MRIDSLEVKGLYGHLNFKKRFHPYLNFLIGINGSGKTSALNVLAWTLFPSFRRLAALEFDEIRIKYSTQRQRREKIELVAKRLKSHIELTISSEREPLLVPIFELAPEYLAESRERPSSLSEMYERFTADQKDNLVLKSLKDLTGPLYLPLDRRWEQEPQEPRPLRRYYGTSYYRGARYVHTGVIGPVLYLAEKYYRERQSELNKLNEDIRERIVASAFDRATSVPQRISQPWTAKKVRTIKEKTLKGLQETGIQVPTETVSKYFVRLEKIAKALEKKKIEPDRPAPKAFIEWIMNRPQIQWIEDIIQRIDEFNKQKENSLARIESFLQSVNSFLRDSNKQVAFDASGEIFVQMGGGHEIKADNLSSGETQLLTLFAYLYFAFPEQQEFVVMIDEPELSLHPQWQHQYVTSLAKANPNVQFILATHSPEIVQQYKSFCIEMTLGK